MVSRRSSYLIPLAVLPTASAVTLAERAKVALSVEESFDLPTSSEHGALWYMRVKDVHDPYCFNQEKDVFQPHCFDKPDDPSCFDRLCSGLTANLKLYTRNNQEVTCAETSEPTLWVDEILR